ncbi:hypothetical protein QBC39DRAFT_358272 [Podospora conica]|nr:hypothetical protein QBC39DRAFT_358272 [Schizothecium conicum]
MVAVMQQTGMVASPSEVVASTHSIANFPSPTPRDLKFCCLVSWTKSNFAIPAHDTTTMNAVLRIPEIVMLVFQQCDGFQDAIALASTCEFMASIWRLHFSSIIWPIAKAEIPGFSQALMAGCRSESPL